MAGDDGRLYRQPMAVLYQPFFNLHSDRLQGFEALSRKLPRHTPLNQASPTADWDGLERLSEETAQVDQFVLDQALQELAGFQGSDRRDLLMSVNLSWDWVRHGGVVADVQDALRRHGVRADRLLLDVSVDTLRISLLDGGHPVQLLAALRAAGTAICVDRFTHRDLDLLPHLQQVPIDVLKMHPGEISEDTVVRDQVRFADLVATVQDRGLPVVAAGIETQEDLRRAYELGCEWGQGFLLGVPDRDIARASSRI